MGEEKEVMGRNGGKGRMGNEREIRRRKGNGGWG